MVLLIAIAYTTATMQGRKIKLMGIKKYIGRKRQGEISDGTAAFILVCMVKPNNFVEQCADVVAGVNDTWSQ